MSDTQHDTQGHDDHHDDHGDHPHVVSFWLLLAIFIALAVLTVVTVEIAQFHFGEFNLVIAMLIALVKASLVVLFFMHLYWDSLFNAMCLIAALAFVALFIGLSILDTGEYKGNVDTWKQANPGVYEPVEKKSLGGSSDAPADAAPAAGGK